MRICVKKRRCRGSTCWHSPLPCKQLETLKSVYFLLVSPFLRGAGFFPSWNLADFVERSAQESDKRISQEGGVGILNSAEHLISSP